MLDGMFPGYQIQFELEYSCLMAGYQQIRAESIIEIRETRAPIARHESNAMALHIKPTSMQKTGPTRVV